MAILFCFFSFSEFSNDISWHGLWEISIFGSLLIFLNLYIYAFAKFGKISAIIFSNTFLVPLSFSSHSRTLMTGNIKIFVIVSHVMEAQFKFFELYFLLVVQICLFVLLAPGH